MFELIKKILIQQYYFLNVIRNKRKHFIIFLIAYNNPGETVRLEFKSNEFELFRNPFPNTWYWSEINRIEFDWFFTDFQKKWDTTRLVDSFGMIPNSSGTDFGTARIGSDWIPFQNFRKWTDLDFYLTRINKTSFSSLKHSLKFYSLIIFKIMFLI